MSKPFAYWVQLVTVLGASVMASASQGSDPAVRERLRSVDGSVLTLQPDPTLLATMQRLAMAESPISVDLDGVFAEPTFTPPASFDGAEFRKWRDNTGTYDIEARLSIIYPDKVRLTKPNGRTTTVPMQRLSNRDLAYVRWVADRLMQESQDSAFIARQGAVSEYPAR